MMKTAVFCALFTMAAMSMMLYYSANKVIVVTDVAQDEVIGNAQEKPAMTEDNTITFEKSDESTGYFCIPLPEGVKLEDVTMENHYMDQELWVSVRTGDEDGTEAANFYEAHSASGNRTRVLEGHYEAAEGVVSLRFRLTGIYEYRSVFQDNSLYVEFLRPKEAYDRIVVIDAAYGGIDYGVRDGNFLAKNVTLDITKRLKEKLDGTDVKVYYTRMDDSNPTQQDRLKLAEMAEADMLIRIEVAEAENAAAYGTETVCNSRYFIPDFGSVDLADMLERQVVTSISGKAGGLLEAGQEDAVIREATIPAAAVRVGYMTNEKENYLLRREDYLEKIAEGIYQAIKMVYGGSQNE